MTPTPEGTPEGDPGGTPKGKGRRKAKRRAVYWRVWLGWGGRMVVRADSQGDARLRGLLHNERLGMVGQVVTDGPYRRGEVPLYTVTRRKG